MFPAVLNFMSIPSRRSSDNAQATDISQSKFPLPMVISIVMAVASLTGGYYGMKAAVAATQSDMRSDVRDILTKMDNQKTVQELQTKLYEKDAAAVKSSVNELRLQVDAFKADLKAVQGQVSELRDTVIRGQAPKR